MKVARIAVLALACLTATASTARGQAATETTERKGTWEAGAGATWFFGGPLGSSSATLEQASGQDFVLFRTETSMDGGGGLSASVAWFPTARVALEAAFSYARPGVSTEVTGDFEDVPPTTASIRLHQYLVEGSVRWYLARRLGAFQPYLRAGAGYLRQLDSDHAHVETGVLSHAGIGLDRVLREHPDAAIERLGLRLEARVTGRSGGFDVEDAFRISGAAGVAIFFGF